LSLLNTTAITRGNQRNYLTDGMRHFKEPTADFSTQRPSAPVGVWQFCISLVVILITILDFVVFFRANLYLYLNLTKSATTLRRLRCGELTVCSL